MKRFSGRGANGEPVSSGEILCLLMAAREDHTVVGKNTVNVKIAV
jgi:hypothetical protein